ncbi:MAG: hypothetical protein R8J85_02130 [Mariprofundales bacterium]
MKQNQRSNPHLITLGHDLNNVWAGLLGCTEVLQMMIPPDTPEQEHIQMLLNGIERGEQITQKIRAIAHADTLPDHRPPPEFNTAHLNTSAISLNNPTLDQDHHQLEQLASKLMQTQTTPDALAIIANIYRDCLHHSYREEQIMLQCPDYPFRDHHHNTHCALLHQLQQIETHCSIANSNDAYIKEEIQQITTMLSIHILGMDAGMAPYIAAKPELVHFHYALPDDATLAKHFTLSPHDTHRLA